MIIYEDVGGTQFKEEFMRVLPAHYDELCITKQFPFDPDWDAYDRMAQAGMLRTITVRNDAELIGYIVFYIQPHLHYKSCLTAYEDVYYVKPEYRKGRIGIKMFQYAEMALKRIGVNRIIVHTKIHLDNTKLLEYLGYSWSDKLFTKVIQG
jgi:GNAT superfamily N-acetyltransferase